MTWHKVFIGEFRVAGAPDRMAIHGLGSCVALLLHDPGAAISALGHVLLPEPPSSEAPGIPGRFASTAVPAMLDEIRHRSDKNPRLWAKLVGGAQMFQFERALEMRHIGERNLEATLAALEKHGIPVIGRDTGGSYGRTVMVDAGTGRMHVRTVRLEEKVL